MLAREKASEVAVRMPSAVASASVVLAMWLVGRELGKPVAALVGGSLFACSPFVIYWSQEAKPEALMLGAAAWSSYLMLLAWRRIRRIIWR